MLQTVKGEKVDEQNGVICLVSTFPSRVWFSIAEKSIFLQFCTDPSKKSSSVTAIYIYAPESSHYSLLENDMVYRGLSHHLWDISNYNIRKDADSAGI